MKITEETKVKDLIPEGYELDSKWESPVPYSLGDGGAVSFYIKKKKSKTLEDYEYKLILSDTTNVMYHGSKVSYYQILKENNPKQYYSIILQMIADDICEEKMEFNWCMAFYCSGQVDYRNLINETKPQGTVLFDTLANVKKARDILGDNIKFLI